MLLNTIISWLVNTKIISPKLGSNRKTCNHFKKSRCISELSWNLFEKYKCSGIALFLQSSRYISNEQSCLKTTGSYDGLLLLSSLFHFFYFIFSVPISFSLCSPVSLSLPFIFLMFFLKLLSSVVEKLLYTKNRSMYYMYILENLWIFA